MEVAALYSSISLFISLYIVAGCAKVHLRRKVKVFLALFYIFFTFLRNINILLVSSLLGLLCTLALRRCHGPRQASINFFVRDLIICDIFIIS